MAIVAISGEPGCRAEEVAGAVARELQYQFIHESRLAELLREAFGTTAIPVPAAAAASGSVVASLAAHHHLVVAFPLDASLVQTYPAVLRIHLTGSLNRRLGNLMIDRGLDRASAKALLAELEAQSREWRRCSGAKIRIQPDEHDITCNIARLDSHHIASLARTAAESLRFSEAGFLPPAAEAHLQFRYRLQLSKHGIAPAGHASLKPHSFGHPSEEMFANLLDFYRIRWEYEPRSFPLQWDKDGTVTEAFTPDFYLPEFDLYVELTTMKQALVTRKNRKVKLLRAIYPHVNIQVFYQKDFQDLVFKYGLSEKLG
jgi:cytidylate kinase